MRASKWPEQEPAPGEDRFDFVLRMALIRRIEEQAKLAARQQAKRDFFRATTRQWTAQDRFSST